MAGRLRPDAIAVIEAHAAGCAACLDLLATAMEGAPASAVAATKGASSPFIVPGHGTTRSVPLERGSAVARYVILSLVGRGGMGNVYAAYDPELDRRVAVKLLSVGRSDVSPDEARARLLREAKAIARLSHPNVVVVHDAGTWEERVFIAMEFVEGETLGSWLTLRPRTWREVRDVFVGAGRGLAAAHAAGLVHRDFKPQNVMVGRDGSARVTDFGLARQLDAYQRVAGARAGVGAGAATDPQTSEPPLAESPDAFAEPLTRTGVLVGTPRYMAPEQFRAETTDARTDQFSFCVALYEALYDQRPFVGDTIPTLRAAVLEGHVREAPEKSTVPAWLRRIVVRGLQVDRADRFSSMEDLLGALGRDPARQKRRFLVAAALVAAFVGAGITADRMAHRTQGLCRGGADKLAGIWEPAGGTGSTPRRSGIERAFLATQLSGASETWERASRALDEYAKRWTAAYTDTCEATQVRGDQSAEVLDLRMGCLQERLGQVRALTDVFGSADAPVVLGAVNAVDALGALERCADVPLLRAVVPPPRDAKMVAAVKGLSARVAEVKALRDAGRLREGLGKGVLLVHDAQAVNYKPLLAEALDLVGWLQSQTGDFRGAEANFSEAVWTAEAGHHDEIRASAAAVLAGVVGFDLSRRNESERWARFADAVLERMGPGHDRIAAWILADRGLIRYHMGDFAGALKLGEQAEALKEKVLGPEHPDVGLSLNNIDAALSALHEYDRALAVNDRALSIFRRAYGDNHPQVAQCLSNRGETLNALGRYDEARAAFQGALHRWESTLGPNNRDVAYATTGLGVTDLATGNPREAVVELERAVRIRDREETDPIPIAETRFVLARALWENGGDRSRARTLAGQARVAYAALPHFASEVRAVDAWLAAHVGVSADADGRGGRGGRAHGAPKVGRASAASTFK